jgi:hypothetical protein
MRKSYSALLLGTLLLGAHTARAESSASIFQCATDIDYLWEGNWELVNGVQTWGTNLGTPFTRAQMPEQYEELRKVDWELGDIHYRRITGGGSWGEWHSELLDSVNLSGASPVVYGYASVGCVPDPVVCYGDATKKKTYTLAPIDWSASTHTLWKSIEASQASFSNVWNGEGNVYYRGTRTPNVTGGVSLAKRRAILSTASSVANHDIDYTWADMLENKWTGWDQDWDGTVKDIDELRCDGVPEYSYESNSIRVWGADDNWNIGNGSDHNLNQHNELWEHDDFDYGELSPVVQAGCGGYGDGGRTTLRDRSTRYRPEWSQLTIANSGVRANFSAMSVGDYNSGKVFVSVQVYYAGGWRFVTDSNGQYWKNREWSGGYGVPLAFQAIPGEEYAFHANQKWRVTVIDEGLNANIQEYVTASALSSGGQQEIQFVAPYDGIYDFALTGIPAGSDFDVYAYDQNHGGFVVASGTNGSNTDEKISFFALEHTRITFIVTAYSGSGSYSFQQTSQKKAWLFQPSVLHSLEAANQWEKTISMPGYSSGWAIAWGDWRGNTNDVELQILENGQVLASSTGVGPTEVIYSNLGNFYDKAARIYTHSKASDFRGTVRLYRF